VTSQAPFALSPARQALLRALAAGASVEEAARATSWTPDRVRREAAAALAQLDPEGVAAAAPAPSAPETAEADGEAVPERPAVAAEVVVEPAPPAGEHRVVHDPRSGRYARVKLPQAAFLESLDGERTLQELREDAPLPPAMVVPLVKKFAELGLLDGAPTAPANGRAKTPNRTGGVALKLVMFDPERLMARARPLILTLGRRPVLVAFVYLLVLAGIAFAAYFDAGLLTSDRLGDPVFLGTLLVAMLVTAMVHELGHAAAVTYFGGRVKRLGFMLFYLLPALFCDTSDAWRFPFAWQRVVVAFAGMATQIIFMCVVVQILWLGAGDAVQAWLLLYVLLNLGMCVYNLIPLVKLDGYWALSAAIDRPNLRAQSIGRASAWTRRLLFAEPVRRERGDGPAVIFGVACALFGPALIIYGLLRWEEWLLNLGVFGATLWALLLAFVGLRPAKAAWSAARARFAKPGGRGRAAASLAVLAVAVVAAAIFVRVPVSAGGELAPGTLTAELKSGAVTLVEPGDRAELGDRSLTSGRTQAAGTVVNRDGDRWRIVLVPGERRPGGDDVTIRNGNQPVGAWLWHAHLRPAFDALWP